VREQALTMAIHTDQLGSAAPTAPAAPASLDDRLRALTAKAPVMLFMKGNPEAPRCGFSRKIVDLLQSEKVNFETFDILEDEEVTRARQHSSSQAAPHCLIAADAAAAGAPGPEDLLELADVPAALRGRLAARRARHRERDAGGRRAA